MPTRSIRSLIYFSLFTYLLVFTLPISAAPAHPTTKKVQIKKSKKKRVAKGKSAVPALPSTLDITTGIDQILSKSQGNLNIGILVRSADTGVTLYQHNATKFFTPASTMKTFTGAAALSYLGPNYIFQTQLLTNGQVSPNGVLNGNLYVKFSGDPELTLSDLDAMISSLSRQGIHHIQGHLVIDDMDTDRENMAPGWLPKEQIVCYAAPSNAIIINRNCFSFYIVSGKKNGDPVQTTASPNLANINVTSQAITSTSRNACALLLKPYGNNTGTNAYLLTGCVKPKRNIGVGVALNDTRAAGTSIIRYLLQQYCITLAGNVYYQKTPANLHLLANHDSRPLCALITKMLKKSDNLIAGALLKKLGATYFNTSGTWQNGSQALRSLLTAKAGIDFRGSVNVDGSGLSRFDALSPNQFGKLLQYAYHMPFNNIFYQALPSSGIDGTLRGRLGGATLGKVHAKTGTVDGTSGLVGYIHTVNHQNLIFAILINNPVAKGSQGTYHYIQDRIAQFLALHAPFNVQPNVTPKPVTPTIPLKQTTAPAAMTPKN